MKPIADQAKPWDWIGFLLRLDPIPPEFEKLGTDVFVKMIRSGKADEVYKMIATIGPRPKSLDSAAVMVRSLVAAAEKTHDSWILQYLAESDLLYHHGMYLDVLERIAKDAATMNDPHVLQKLARIAPERLQLEPDFIRRLLSAAGSRSAGDPCAEEFARILGK